MAFLTQEQRRGSRLALVALGATVLFVSLLWYCYDASTPANYCSRMVVKLNRSVDPEALRQAAGGLVRKYAEGQRHIVSESEQPEPVRRVMKSLGLAEAAVGEGATPGQRVLSMAAPGGFASYGVVVAPPGAALVVPTKKPGLTVLKWGDGIYVFYFTS